MRNAIHGVDYIFHAVALKQVPSCEFFSIESVKTNVHGTENVLTAAIETQAKAVIQLFGGKEEDIKVIGIRHGEKMYETLLTNEECAHAIDMGDFYHVPCDKRGLNYDKYFTQGNTQRDTLSEFNSNNTQLLNVAQTKRKTALLQYIQEGLKGKK